MKKKFTDPHLNEPKFAEGQITIDNYRKELSDTLNWYSVKSKDSDWKKWGDDYFINHLHIAVDLNKYENTLASTFKSIGVLWRMVQRGFPQELIQEEISNAHWKTLESLGNKKVEEKKEKPNIQKFTPEEHKFIESMNHYIDDVLQNKTYSGAVLITLINSQNFEGRKFRNYVVNLFEKPLKEYNEFGTEIFSEKFIKKNGKLYSGFLEFCLLHINSKIAATPKTPSVNSDGSLRAKKPKDPKKIVSKLKMTSKAGKLEKIVGAEVLWVYSPEKRMLYYYEASNKNEGMSVKGKSLTGFSEDNSFSKMIRKPELFLPILEKNAKGSLLKEFVSLSTTKKTGLSGGLSDNMVLYRIF